MFLPWRMIRIVPQAPAGHRRPKSGIICKKSIAFLAPSMSPVLVVAIRFCGFILTTAVFTLVLGLVLMIIIADSHKGLTFGASLDNLFP